MKYSKEVDQKWQKIWADKKVYAFDAKDLSDKKYVLEMFSYPSAAQLHLGHWYNFGPSDSYARLKKMQGFNVFHPMGFDAFGLPAENYAIATGIHPQDSTLNNIKMMTEQLKAIGATYDWDYTLSTCLPDYYKWTQWLFLKLFDKGLAYRKEAPVNWCPKCQTVLANEQVIDGKCERCSSLVERKKLTQWFWKITDYAQKLLDDIKTVDWPEATKKIQTNWIGRSEGAEITFTVDGTDLSFDVFTTRPDTLYGCTYVVIAPEHDLVKKITTPDRKKAVDDYIRATSHVSDIDRTSTEREKTGVFTGAFAVNPVNGRKVPIWIADYVLEGYGTGCVMAVPSHDERDYVFAKKYKHDIIPVIQKTDQDVLPMTDDGFLINSAEFNGVSSADARIRIVEKLFEEGAGRKKVTYKLRDWLVSRQRYWGAPIPVIHCPDCGIVPVPEKDLPVKLPYDVEFKPDGKSPLAKSEAFMNVKCPLCGADARRDPDTLDTFVCSSWYYLRYPDAKNDRQAFDPKIINNMLPVDVYVGGQEHASMHLIYARFVTKVLHDLGYLSFNEPFTRLVHQGMILGPDGQKMSKSKGNVVSPNIYVDQYGSDVLRLYLMFGFSYIDGGPWSDEGVKAISKFVSRIETLLDRMENATYSYKDTIDAAEKDLLYQANHAIKSITTDMENFQFNTSIARIMELLNAINAYEQSDAPKNKKILDDVLSIFIRLIAPMAPHFAEELWERLGQPFSVHQQMFPTVDEQALVKSEIELPVQVNGKLRGTVLIPKDAEQDAVLSAAKKVATVARQIDGKKIVKTIYVKGKIFNIIAP